MANVVADALSRRTYLTLSSLLTPPRELCEDFMKLELNMVTRETRPILYIMDVSPPLLRKLELPKHEPAIG